ncbi:MAG: DUF1080 domain-containing protein [Candidatus Firestonebacteria bacterium]|nr:DUF1080 domain-containing protein [Candidatus Firestonebacteria bacterium]
MFLKLLLAVFVGLNPVYEYRDNFSSQELKNWEKISGNWEVKGNTLQGTSGGGDGLLFYKGVIFKNFTMECSVKVENREGSLFFRAVDRENFYLLVFNPKVANVQGSVLLLRRLKGRETYFAGCEQQVKTKEWVKLKVVCEGKRIDIYLNDKFTISAEDENLESGYAGLRVFGDIFNGCNAYFKDFLIKSQEEKIEKNIYRK